MSVKREPGEKQMSQAPPLLDAILAAVRPPQEAPHVSPQVRRLLAVLAGEMSRRDILHALGLRDRKSLRERYLVPALQDGYVEMTCPDAPNARNQKYRLTALARQLRATGRGIDEP